MELGKCNAIMMETGTEAFILLAYPFCANFIVLESFL